MVDVSYLRYVAVGDSQTEGLWDGDDDSGVIGFADRLASRLEELRPGVLYANLAVRGRRIRDVLDDQLPKAIDMQPDLITSCIGMNDVAQILPIGRVLNGRVVEMNAVIRAAAARHGFRLVDLYHAPSLSDPEIWSPDRVHGSPGGHVLFAEAAAEALDLPGSNHDWAAERPDVVRPGLRSRMYSQMLWTQNLLMPWVWRHLRGRSSGHGRDPKRPRLEGVTRTLETETE